MKANELNKWFDISRAVPDLLSFDEYAVLMAEGKIYITTARFYGFQAEKAMGAAPEGYPYSEEQRNYSGSVIANCWSEAILIAEHRGWGETIDGVLSDEIPAGDVGNGFRTDINLN